MNKVLFMKKLVAEKITNQVLEEGLNRINSKEESMYNRKDYDLQYSIVVPKNQKAEDTFAIFEESTIKHSYTSDTRIEENLKNRILRKFKDVYTTNYLYDFVIINTNTTKMKILSGYDYHEYQALYSTIEKIAFEETIIIDIGTLPVENQNSYKMSNNKEQYIYCTNDYRYRMLYNNEVYSNITQLDLGTLRYKPVDLREYLRQNSTRFLIDNNERVWRRESELIKVNEVPCTNEDYVYRQQTIFNIDMNCRLDEETYCYGENKLFLKYKQPSYKIKQNKKNKPALKYRTCSPYSNNIYRMWYAQTDSPNGKVELEIREHGNKVSGTSTNEYSFIIYFPPIPNIYPPQAVYSSLWHIKPFRNFNEAAYEAEVFFNNNYKKYKDIINFFIEDNKYLDMVFERRIEGQFSFHRIEENILLSYLKATQISEEESIKKLREGSTISAAGCEFRQIPQPSKYELEFYKFILSKLKNKSLKTKYKSMKISNIEESDVVLIDNCLEEYKFNILEFIYQLKEYNYDKSYVEDLLNLDPNTIPSLSIYKEVKKKVKKKSCPKETDLQMNFFDICL